jgi:hypothetical protein
VWLRPAGWGVVGVDQIGDNLLYKNARHHGFPVRFLHVVLCTFYPSSYFYI